ncbi:hypothetical protein [Fusobacterium mortiferum]|nr:hypothetical protein [Fusobacterium mortiferum]
MVILHEFSLRTIFATVSDDTLPKSSHKLTVNNSFEGCKLL